MPDIDLGGPLASWLERHPIFAAAVWDPLIQKGMHAAAEFVAKEFEEGTAHKKDRHDKRFTFGEVLVAVLDANDANTFRIIAEFMVDTDGLATDAERGQFKHSISKIGGDTIDPSVKTLQALANHFPDHAARREFALAQGWIGPRAMTNLEHGIEHAKSAGETLTTKARDMNTVFAASPIRDRIRDLRTRMADRARDDSWT